MPPDTRHDIKEIASHFQLEGHFLEAAPCGSGHINDTYASCFRLGSQVRRYIHQRINHNVFQEPCKVMENIERVTNYTRECVAAVGGDPNREALTLIPALDGGCYYCTPEGDYWRTYVFIDGARTYDVVENPRHVYTASRAFGSFQRLLSSLPGERLHETIPNFHHTRQRFDAFVRAVEKDAVNRAASVKAEIDFVLRRKAQTSLVLDLLAQGKIPERVTHNDTKLNNVMIDDVTGAGLCVIDLDTVMPGSALYDFGDSVRIGASTAAEDEPDLDKVGVDLGMFELLAQGYLDAARDFLTPTELEHLAFSARLLALEQGIRFLADHINGDIYYKIHHPGHNLERARTQFKMLAEMEQKSDEMEDIISRYC